MNTITNSKTSLNMCGIFSLLNNTFYTTSEVSIEFQKGKQRGPEYSTLKNITIGTHFGFHRLAINGLNNDSNQPIVINNVSLICNGEIYNYRELFEMLEITPTTNSDCEVIIHMYLRYGIESTLQLLDGVFSFILFDDHNHLEESEIYVARDPYGVRPLYVLEGSKMVGFASEMKMLSKFLENNNKLFISQFQPGCYSLYKLSLTVTPVWSLNKKYVKYHNNTFFSNSIFNENKNMNEYLNNIRSYLVSAVFKRCSNTERPIACLLSGGLDSSIITSLVSLYHNINGLPPIETYSIGLEGSEDLVYARKVANHLKTKHTEIKLREQDFIDVIPEVITAIESYDTTSVRASIGNYLIGKYISQHSLAKVIFNGDGSDELMGGYLYFSKAPNELDFDKECRRLLKDISYFDVLRSDKCISSHGLEPRTPFLDRNFTQYYLSIPAKTRYVQKYNFIEKYLLRAAFSPEKNEKSVFTIKDVLFTENSPLLPKEILWRKKEAFSDGVSGTNRSLYTILQEHINSLLISPSIVYSHNTPHTFEQLYYRELFEKQFPGMGEIVPYFWMPKFITASDPSARTLSIYSEEKTV